MNGMRAKKLRREKAKRLTPEGLPRDPNAWLPSDWASLWRAYQSVVREVSERHREDKP